MIDKVHSAIGLNPLLPSIGQRSKRIIIRRSSRSRRGAIARNCPVATGPVTLVWVEEPLILHLQHLKCRCRLQNESVNQKTFQFQIQTCARSPCQLAKFCNLSVLGLCQVVVLVLWST